MPFSAESFTANSIPIGGLHAVGNDKPIGEMDTLITALYTRWRQA